MHGRGKLLIGFFADVTPIPEALPSADAASILCAVRGALTISILRYLIYNRLHATQGVTVYRAIKYSQTQQGDWIVLPGAGGGLGHLAVQYAVTRGLRVIAIGGLFPPPITPGLTLLVTPLLATRLRRRQEESRPQPWCRGLDRLQRDSGPRWRHQAHYRRIRCSLRSCHYC